VVLFLHDTAYFVAWYVLVGVGVVVFGALAGAAYLVWSYLDRSRPGDS
jgi:hypothetical protein